MPTEKQKPVHEIRFGRIKSVIWPAEGQYGRFFNITISRIFRDDGTWKESTSFGRDDLPLVAKVADMTHTWIFAHGQEQNGSKQQEPSTSTNEEF
jgi:hypothetical protein